MSTRAIIALCACAWLLACPNSPSADSGGGEAAGREAKDAAPFDYCNGLPTDPACYADKRDPESERVALAMAIADRHMQTHPATQRSWNWVPAVFMLSLTELYRVTGEARFLEHYQAWMDHHMAEGYAMFNSDRCVPAAVAAALYAETGDPAYLDVLSSVDTYLGEVALRDEDGALNHLGSVEAEGGVTLWIDSLFMLGTVMTRWGELRDDEALLDDIGLQFTLFAGHLQDPSGLFVHAYQWKDVDSTIFWARGNGWVAASGPDYLRARLLRAEPDAEVEAIMRDQARAIVETQDPSGLWWSVINRPGEIYLETSGSALMAYGLARGYRYGFYDADVLPTIERAVAGIEARVARDPHDRPYVTGISGPTNPGGFDDYAKIELVDDTSYGAGAVILLLLESSGLPAQ